MHRWSIGFIVNGAKLTMMMVWYLRCRYFCWSAEKHADVQRMRLRFKHVRTVSCSFCANQTSKLLYKLPISRRDEVKQCIDHTCLTRSYLLADSDQPQYQQAYVTCQCPLAVKHILVECEVFSKKKVNVKVKVRTLDIAPLRSESSPQKRSGTGRVLKGSHSFTCTLTRSIRNRNEPYLPNLPSQLQLVLIYRPRRDGRLNWPDTRNKLFVPFSVEQLVIPNLVKRVFVRFRFRLFETVDVCKVLDVINQKPTFISCDYSLVLVGFLSHYNLC